MSAKAAEPVDSADRTEFEDRFMELLTSMAHRYRAELEQRLRPLGCGASGMEVLSAIKLAGRPIAQNEIAARMGILNSTLTRLIVPLERAGQIHRVPDPTNLRAKLVELTPQGAKHCDELLAIARQFRAQMLEGLELAEIEATSAISARLFDRLYAKTC